MGLIHAIGEVDACHVEAAEPWQSDPSASWRECSREPILRKKQTRSRMAESFKRQSSESGRMADLIAEPNCPALSAAR